MKELSIKVTIGNRVYPLTIKPQEEESIRKAAKLVNENIKELESSYAVRDKQDLLAMTALYFANVFLEKQTSDVGDSKDSIAKAKQLNQQLESYLKKA